MMAFITKCLLRQRRGAAPGEAGIAFLETLAALALLGIVAVTFLSGLTTTSQAAIINDRETTALSLAQAQLDWVKQAAYTENATTYAIKALPAADSYANFSASITAAALNTPDDGIQKITVIISKSGSEVSRLEGYKTDQ